MNSILSLYRLYIKFLFSLFPFIIFKVLSLKFLWYSVQSRTQMQDSKVNKINKKNKPLLKIKGKSPKYTSPGQKHDCWVGTHKNNKQGKLRHWQGGIKGY